jgi:hypothetical protein
MPKLNVYFDGNGSDVIAVQGLGEFAPVAQLVQATQERDALAAQVKRLAVTVDKARDLYIEEHADGETDCVTPFDWYGVAPDRYLAEIRAEAVAEFAFTLAEAFPCGMSGGDVFALAKAYKGGKP